MRIDPLDVLRKAPGKALSEWKLMRECYRGEVDIDSMRAGNAGRVMAVRRRCDRHEKAGLVIGWVSQGSGRGEVMYSLSAAERIRVEGLTAAASPGTIRP